MVAAVNALASQIDVVAVGESAPDAKVSQFDALTVYNIPSESADVSQLGVNIVAESAPDAWVSQFDVIVVMSGRTANPNVIAWTYSMDDHDYYILKLGETETLVYDFYSEQWSVWGSDDANLWAVSTGKNWLGGRRWAETYGSNVLVGDYDTGALYFLDPYGSTDDDPVDGETTPHLFTREITGQVATRSIGVVPCHGVQLMGAIGETLESSLASVTLSTSDDQGHTYDDHGTLTVDVGDYNARVEWRSLGSFVAPGRLFKVRDYGALHRIDYLEMIDPPGRD